MEKNPKYPWTNFILKLFMEHCMICHTSQSMSSIIDAPPKLLERLKCESETQNNERKTNWGTLFNLQHFEGKKAMLEL